MVQEAFKPPAPKGATAVSIKGGSFAWQKENDSLLKDIDLEVPSGQLIIVIGEVRPSWSLASLLEVTSFNTTLTWESKHHTNPPWQN